VIITNQIEREEAKKLTNVISSLAQKKFKKSSLLYYPIRYNGGSVYLRNGGEE
jgi:hypothetical protein